ncbi:hypothetical protein CR983_01835 [Candidatus Saccharibacteria bacterium]|nr:MAG: hypothetical protein CR983_01835 [Candidatus Saccharibacteria bacterium]
MNTRNHKVGLVSTDDAFLRGGDVEIGRIDRALNDAGVASEIVVWHEAHDWSSFDALIIRSPWDYPDRVDEFHDWLDTVSKSTRLFNPPELIRWNFDKQYLRDLEAAGVRCTPTAFCSHLDQSLEAAETVLASGKNCIIKPTISASSRKTGLFGEMSAALCELCRSILDEHKLVMVQPALASVQEGREKNLLFFNGVFSHAIHKGVILAPGGGYLKGTQAGQLSLADATDDEIALGLQVMTAIDKLAAQRGWPADAALPLYARIDVAPDEDDRPVLIEAELFEPQLYLRMKPASFATFVAAVKSRLE